ncbi:uncharacterized protein [Miscanthus floridulus]|uniref:uncharacterized protein n=1 Tax=Miscanthus floridulus TaxID=154761 RepID=UPI003457FAE5
MAEGLAVRRARQGERYGGCGGRGGGTAGRALWPCELAARRVPLGGRRGMADGRAARWVRKRAAPSLTFASRHRFACSLSFSALAKAVAVAFFGGVGAPHTNQNHLRYVGRSGVHAEPATRRCAANILRRLTPRFLATSRCVCKPWCTIIDTRRLVRADLLPLSLAGIFINFHDLVLSEFFSRSSTGPTISDCLPPRDIFSDHCNGLLLLDDYVVNPATYQWVQLPPFPSPHLGTENFFHKEHLVFDPAVSPHYEVFLIPFACARSVRIKLNPATEELEWPLSPCILHVFSSRTKKWEERSFVREGEAAGTVADMRLDGSYSNHYHNSVYWRGALYVHCQHCSSL